MNILTWRARCGVQRWHMLPQVLLTLCLAATTSTAWTDGGRDFAGEFVILSQDAIDAQHSLVTVRLRVQNVSGHAVVGAKVEFVPDLLAIEGTVFPAQLTLADRDVAVIEGSFTVATESSAMWVSSGQPTFRVTYTDASGNTWQRPVEAIQMPFVPESQP